MRALVVAVSLLITAQADAFDADFRSEFPYKPEAAWETEALKGIKRVSRKVTDTMWGKRGSLWIEVKNDGTDWEKAGRSFCLTLRGAGKPEQAFVILSFWRIDEVVAKVNCD